jgi:branched-chain amino acid transport system permease protein
MAALRMIQSRKRSLLVLIPIVIAVVFVFLPTFVDNGLTLPFFGGGPALLRETEVIAIYAMVAVGLNLSYGFAGEFALGQAAMFAAGAYTTGILIKGTLYHHQINELAILLPASAVVAGVVGFISGVPGLRLSGWALAYTSFFLVLIVPDMASAFPNITGGFTGLSPIPYPEIFGHALGDRGLYVTIIICLALVAAVFRNIVLSRHGAALAVLRQSPVLASSLGISVYRIKLLTYVVSAMPAGIAGCLLVYLNSFLTPGFFDIYTTIGFIAASVLGGSRTVYGALIGTFIVQELGPLHTSVFKSYAYPVYGLLLVIGGVVLTGGLGGTFMRIVRAVRRRMVHTSARTFDTAEPTYELGTFVGERLTVQDVSKSFGGNHALSEVSMTAAPGEVTAIIGPNGSGKTTLLNMICGFYKVDAGTIALGERSLIPNPPDRIARSGVARTFQTPAIPAGLNCLQVVAAARFALDRSMLVAAILRLPSYRRRVRADRAEALRLLAATGLGALAGTEATSLPLGTRRLLELARVLAARPSLVLLDEPASGLDTDDVRRLSRLVRAAAESGATVVVIEHNFQMILEVADRINVLREGRLIANGTPDEIRQNPVVLESYIGTATEVTQ